ncbi:Rossmann-like domain-containing protein [Geopseudomonas aromaticivorans]
MSALYDWLLASAAGSAPVERLQLGLNWTLAEVAGGLGFAFSPRQVSRTLSWAGTLAGRPGAELRPWLLSWNAAEAAVGLAVLNASLNGAAACLREARPLRGEAPGHLRVFAHFRPQLDGQQVVVIGRYPGLDQLWWDLPYQCLERQPQDGDLPDSAAEYLLPQADWVFVTASSLANKTLPRLLELSRQARVVLMGPSLPWLEGWRQFGVDYLAGVQVLDAPAARQVVAEGGGTRLFAGPVEYALLALDC